VDDNTFFLSYTGVMKTLTKTAQVIDHYGGISVPDSLWNMRHPKRKKR
jgi:hypothetical protein